MSRKPISMRKIKEILRLKLECGLSGRKVAASCNVARATVQEYIGRAQAAGLSVDQINAMPEEELDQKLFPSRQQSNSVVPVPDYPVISSELRRPGVTLQLLWEVYVERHPDGYSYSQFCHLYRQFSRNSDITMRQVHKAGEKCFTDYSGKTIEVIDQETGEVRNAEIFVAVLGASNYTYAEATWTQSLEDWIGSHVRAFDFFGGVPAALVRQKVELRATTHTVEVYHCGNRVASHMRSIAQGKHSTDREHMLQQHQFCKWNPQRLMQHAREPYISVPCAVKL